MTLKVSNKNRKSTTDNPIPEPIIDTDLLKKIELGDPDFPYLKFYTTVAIIIAIIFIV
jgi:hypothetical protein